MWVWMGVCICVFVCVCVCVCEYVFKDAFKHQSKKHFEVLFKDHLKE